MATFPRAAFGSLDGHLYLTADLPVLHLRDAALSYTAESRQGGMCAACVVSQFAGSPPFGFEFHGLTVATDLGAVSVREIPWR